MLRDSPADLHPGSAGRALVGLWVVRTDENDPGGDDAAQIGALL